MKPKNPFRINLGDRRHAFESGEALSSHIEAVHQGVFDENCPACLELQRRTSETEDNETEKHEE